jgi:excisionase family DNA binding protein
MAQPEWMVVPEIAAYLRVTPRHVYRLVEEKQLPAYRLGDKVIRVRRTDVEALLVRI